MNIPDYAARWQLTLVETLDDVAAFTSWIEGLDGMVSIDTETWGLDYRERDFVRLVTFADDAQGWAVPTRWWGRSLSSALATVRDKHLPVAMWNANFDMHALEHDGLPVPDWAFVTDGRIVHHILGSHRSHALKRVAAEELGRWAWVGEQSLKSKAKDLGYGSEWWAVPVDTPEYWQYAIMDTLLTQKLVRDMMPQLTEQERDAVEREMQVAAILFRAENRGMRIDVTYARRTRDAWLLRALELKDFMASEGLDNPLSNQQVERVLRDQGWQPDEFTDTGQAVLDKLVLNHLRSGMHGEIARALIEYKRLVKWTGTYLDPFVESKGRVHPTINTLRARTGRMSITSPPLQTLPSKGSAGAIRRCVLPERGHELWAIDYDGQEARLFANYSADPGMAAAYARGDDLYTYVAQMVWEDDSITKDDERRGQAKVILLAFTYGAGPATLSLASGLPIPQVERFLKQLFTAFPTVRDMTGDHAIGGRNPGGPARSATQRWQDEGMAYVRTSGGRRFSMPADETYKAVNGIMQGGGADVFKSALVRLDRAGLADYIVVPVHDEALFSIPKGEHELAKEASELMADYDWDIPLTVDTTGPLAHWGEAYGFRDSEETDNGPGLDHA